MSDVYGLFEHAPITDARGGEVWIKARAAKEDRVTAQAIADGRTLDHPVPPLTFYLAADDPHSDYVDTDVVGGHLCSQHLVDALSQLSVSMTLHPVRLLNPSTEQPYPLGYYYWVPESFEGAIDWQRSETWTDPDTGERMLTKMVLTDSIEQLSPPLFSPVGRIEVLIHDRVRHRLEVANLSGIDYLPLDVIVDPNGAGRNVVRLRNELEQRPEVAAIASELGHTLLMLERHAKAVEAADYALSLDPSAVKAYLTRGWALRAEGRLEEAARAFQQAVQLDPQSGAISEYSDVLRQLGRNVEAHSVAEQGTRNLPRFPMIWLQLGAAKVALGDYAGALHVLNHAATLGGGPYELLYLSQGRALFELGRYSEALDVYKEGLRFLPASIPLWQGKAKTLRAMGRKRAAVTAERRISLLEQGRRLELK
jgi:tetratricopeptide (TPR) repeat protein